MALVVTPGASDADSYASFAEYSAYCAARGITPSDEADAEIELRKATAYLDNQYRSRWIGIRTNETQSLAWPRMGDVSLYVRDSISYSLVDLDGYEIATDTIPTQIKNATIEAALLVKSGNTLEPTLTRGGAIKSIGKGVGPLRKDITYEDGAPVVDRYTAIEGLLRGLVKSTPGARSGNVSLVRA
jgi:hypothetical protein